MNANPTVRRAKLAFLFLASALLLAACAPSVKVRSDVAPDVDMSQ